MIEDNHNRVRSYYQLNRNMQVLCDFLNKLLTNETSMKTEIQQS